MSELLPNPEATQTFLTNADKGPVVMLNLLKFLVLTDFVVGRRRPQTTGAKPWPPTTDSDERKTTTCFSFGVAEVFSQSPCEARTEVVATQHGAGLP